MKIKIGNCGGSMSKSLSFLLLIYFLFIILPIGIILRICNKDVLDTRYKKIKSYWIDRRSVNYLLMDEKILD